MDIREALEVLIHATELRLDYEIQRPAQVQGQNMTRKEKQMWDEAGRGTYAAVKAALDNAKTTLQN